jgi:hypothetical protein
MAAASKIVLHALKTSVFLNLLLLGACAVSPATPSLSAQQGKEILTELKDLRQLVGDLRQEQHGAQRTDVSPSIEIKDSGANALGSASAQVVLVEYTDYQCPFCKRFHDETLPELKKRYIETGKLRYEVRDMPLSFHSYAMSAAIAAYCGGQQEQFWAIHEALFQSQVALSAAKVRQIALGFGLSAGQFDSCTANSASRQYIESNIAEATRIGISGTPGFILAKKGNGSLAGTLILGAQPITVFIAKVDEMLAEASPKR